MSRFHPWRRSRRALMLSGAGLSAVALLSVGAGSADARQAAVRPEAGTLANVTFTYSEPGGSLMEVGFTGGLTDITSQAGAGSNMAVFTAFNNGFSFKANGGNTNEGSDIIFADTTAGTPITGVATLPAGATLTASINGGSSTTIKGGTFSIPTGAGVGGHRQTTPSVRLSPKSVRAGAKVTISGVAPEGAKHGAKLTLLSNAFPRRHKVAGLPAITTRVLASGRYATTVRIPASTKPNTYGVTGLVGKRYLPVAGLRVRG